MYLARGAVVLEDTDVRFKEVLAKTELVAAMVRQNRRDNVRLFSQGQTAAKIATHAQLDGACRDYKPVGRKQRFEREAKAISCLNNPNICTLHDIGNQDGIDYLVMECVEGETLARRLEKGPLPFDQVLKYGAQIADALDKAHRAGIVHRDLKAEVPSLIRAIARAHAWVDQIVKGEALNQRAIAASIGVNKRYVSKILPLAFLAPDITEMILEGRQPNGLSISDCVNIPMLWNEHRKALGLASPRNTRAVIATQSTSPDSPSPCGQPPPA